MYTDSCISCLVILRSHQLMSLAWCRPANPFLILSHMAGTSRAWVPKASWTAQKSSFRSDLPRSMMVVLIWKASNECIRFGAMLEIGFLIMTLSFSSSS